LEFRLQPLLLGSEPLGLLTLALRLPALALCGLAPLYLTT